MAQAGWILLLYSLPTKRGTARVGIWRQLKKSGALPFRSSGYLLPNFPELREKFQWLAQQVRDAGGEATLAHVTDVEGMTRDQIFNQFNEARAAEYAELTRMLKDLIARQRKISDETLLADLEKLRRQFEEIQRVDFYASPAANEAARLLELAASRPTKQKGGKSSPVLSARRFVGKTWLTRPRPAIDRVGSAWLIRNYIDPKAKFIFAADPSFHPDAISYDMTGVEFTHHGDDCTFETLLKRFGLKDRALRKLGQMIHDADLEDGKFQTIEAVGLDCIFKGWGRQGLRDQEILSRGFQCFDAVYTFLSTQR